MKHLKWYFYALIAALCIYIPAHAGTSVIGPISSSAPDVIIQDQKTSGTAGGTQTYSSNQFFTRTLNTIVRNNNSYASIASNIVTLPSGKWYLCATAPFQGATFTFLGNATAASVLQVYDNTNSVIVSTQNFMYGSDDSDSVPVGANPYTCGYYSLSASAGIIVRYWAGSSGTGTPTVGLGLAAGSGTEVYATFYAWKVG